MQATLALLWRTSAFAVARFFNGETPCQPGKGGGPIRVPPQTGEEKGGGPHKGGGGGGWVGTFCRAPGFYRVHPPAPPGGGCVFGPAPPFRALTGAVARQWPSPLLEEHHILWSNSILKLLWRIHKQAPDTKAQAQSGLF